MASSKKAKKKSPKRRPIYHSIKSRKTVPAVTADGVASIDAIVKTLYDAISFSTGAEPDWDRLRSLFYLGATLTHAKADKTDVMDVEGFISGGRKVIKSRKLASFYESEASRKIDSYGRIAQVFSTYESRTSPADPQPFSRGINSIQLLKENGRWWVLSIFWADESTEGPVPKQYLTRLAE